MGGTESTSTVQPGDIRVNRGHILRRLGRVCWPDGSRPGLPAPASVSFHPSLSLGFDTLGEVAEWVARYDLHAKSWTSGDGHAYIRAEGVWEGLDLEVYGSRLEPADIEDDAPRGTDDAEEHEPKPDHAAGYGHRRGQAWTEES